MTAHPSPLLTLDEASEWLRVSPATLRRMADRGEVPVVRLGRGMRFDPATVRSQLERPAIEKPRRRSRRNPPSPWLS